MQTVATKPTASQILAAKKAAKKSTQQERALKRAGTVKNVDRNRLSTSSKAQKENIAEMLSGAKVSEDEALTFSIMMWLSLQDMRYACNQELINFAEHIIKQVQRLGLYCNTDDPANEKSVAFACREASQAVAQWAKNFDDLSPNQRQLVLRPLSNLFAAYEEFLKDAPARLIAEVSTYSLAVRVTKKAMTFLELDGGLISAVNKVIGGADSRAEARRLKMPYAEFTDRILHAANLLYDVGIQADKELSAMYGKPLNPVRPQRISDVRQPMMKLLAANKGGALVQAVKDSEDIIRHCDNGTGFSCFNWTKHFKRAANLISLMHREAAA
ncbi:hypothetical protein [Neisseria lactamica]|uniref:hypothetical protein n=1 Tax=Neisseria lactamica TaxID=486 RepID=UPI000E586F69|nr:hypothetical protein [Neisseria lactamica]